MYKKQLKELEELLQKCLRPQEKPFKWDHAVTVIQKTYVLQGSEYIWTFSDAKNLTLHPIVTWKFVCLMHKILHEGHQNVLRDAIKYKEKLQNCILYWNSHSDQMAECIVCYCKVLLRKLLFHLTYTNFNGNLQSNDESLRDINICFQLCLDLFDYLEDLLRLQRVIFANMVQHQISVASKKGMCRLSALATIIAECNILYEHLVTILRLLHLELSPDDISGLSDRFNVIFIELKFFYEHVRSQHLQLDHFLDIPYLPAMQPNFYISYTENQPEPTAPLIYDLE